MNQSESTILFITRQIKYKNTSLKKKVLNSKVSFLNPISEKKRGPIKFKSGFIYEGDWLGNMRDGYGVQIWPDGAKYEGDWKLNRAHGKGKFQHVDGDVYEGDWFEDKAHGFGVYIH